MVDRLKQDLENGREPAMSDLIFEVDMENVVTDKANLFTLFHNLSDKTRTVVFQVQTPNFEPKDLALTYRLEPGRSIGGQPKPFRSLLKVTTMFWEKCRVSQGQHGFMANPHPYHFLGTPLFPSVWKRSTVNCFLDAKSTFVYC